MRTVIRASLIALTLAECSKPQEPRVCVPVLHGWLTKRTPAQAFVANQVGLAGQGIFWNGTPVGEEKLTEYVRQLAPKSPVPFLVFDPGPSRNCAFARHVRDILDQNYPCREGACGQGPWTDFFPAFNQQPGSHGP